MVHRTAAALFGFTVVSQVQGVAGGEVSADFPEGDCKDYHSESATCCDATLANNPSCAANVKWAMSSGYYGDPALYQTYGVKKGSSHADFQCALFWIANEKRKKDKTDGKHGCPRPCSSTQFLDCAFPPATALTPAFKVENVKCPTPPDLAEDCKCTETVVVAAECPDPTAQECKALKCEETRCSANTVCPIDTASSSSSLEPWMIALIVTVVLLGLMAVIYMATSKPKKAKKRATRKVKAPPKEQTPPPTPPQPEPSPASFTMAPAPVTTAYAQQPVYSMAAPGSMYAQQPMPGSMYAQQPMNAYQMPVQTTAAPMVQYIQQPEMMPQYIQGPQIYG